MHRLLDVLASGVHDTKNQLFFAKSLPLCAFAVGFEGKCDCPDAEHTLAMSAKFQIYDY